MPESLALCMIVRDEAEQLHRCLDSVAGAVDAIYLTDTGSQDDTVQIARRYGAEIRHFDWCQDFAAARNNSIAGIKEDWLLILDADDEFPIGEAARIRSWLTTPEALTLTVQYQTAKDYTPSPTRRILRNHRGLTFQGVIHETIRPSLPKDRKGHTLKTDIKLIHHGFDAASAGGKHARNLPLLQQAWNDLELQSVDKCYRLIIGNELGRTLIELGEADKGERVLMEALWNYSSGDAEEDLCATGCFSTLIWHYLQNDRGQKAAELSEKMSSSLTAEPTFSLFCGLVCFAYQRFPEALTAFETFAAAWQKGEVTSAIPVSYTGLALWDLQGQCHMNTGRYAEAVRLFSQCVALDSQNKELQTKLHLAKKLAEQ